MTKGQGKQRTNTNKDEEDSDFIHKLEECSEETFPVWTKIVVPKNFDCDKKFLCGFCSALQHTSQAPQPKRTFAETLAEGLQKENAARALITKHITVEQKRIEE